MQMQRTTKEVEGKAVPQPAVKVTVGGASEVITLAELAAALAEVAARETSADLADSFLHELSRPR